MQWVGDDVAQKLGIIDVLIILKRRRRLAAIKRTATFGLLVRATTVV
jgi:hypothetical protein